MNGYALTFASLMLVGGMLGDLFGRRKVMLGGLTLFSAGSVVAAVAPSPAWLLVGRVVMGVGAAGSEPGTLSIIRHLYDDRGGHLLEGIVRPTLEVMLTESPAHLRRRHDPRFGIALIDPPDRQR